jgi:hypothetical protein
MQATKDSVATSSAPSWARKIWFDTGHLCLEMPVVGQPPITLEYSFTEDGLSKVLKTIRQVAETSATYAPRNGKTVLDHPIIKRSRERYKSSAEDRAKAADILRKSGIIK